MNKIITGIFLVAHGTIVCLTYNDGTVEHRDRFTMEELYTEVNMERINSILEVGFTLRGELFRRHPETSFSVQLLLTRLMCSSPNCALPDEFLSCRDVRRWENPMAYGCLYPSRASYDKRWYVLKVAQIVRKSLTASQDSSLRYSVALR